MIFQKNYDYQFKLHIVATNFYFHQLVMKVKIQHHDNKKILYKLLEIFLKVKKQNLGNQFLKLKIEYKNAY